MANCPLFRSNLVCATQPWSLAKWENAVVTLLWVWLVEWDSGVWGREFCGEGATGQVTGLRCRGKFDGMGLAPLGWV